ncbi:AGE family epimerase/isomerase [Paracoccus sp. MBLB3053]|uniref:AGE family epimerase/isomerase n=1 Tax=Paracoccus aurantius TaxID=3073814 RepID=A0ABU2HYA1_9RHOB|nr:AGE family epimerase/isomerase [Paracoccus sp. MBLB3053]MDS9469505.1 AGE family epimerase/isomerase [Paracoccus sp. MBLB3053]
MPIELNHLPQAPRDLGWLKEQAQALWDFHAAALDGKGGFTMLDMSGSPLPHEPRGSGSERALHDVCRMVHSYALATRVDHPQASEIVEKGMRWLLDRQRDTVNGGFFWSVDDAGPIDSRKQAYGHAFVLLAAASAHRAGNGDAEQLRDLALDAIWSRFWEEDHGVVSDTFEVDWTGGLDYRGQNPNMHLTEAFLAAHAAWGDARYLDAATRITTRLIGENARDAGWVVPEHFDSQWQVDANFDGDAMFRPSGTTPGHALEWSRLVVELWLRTGKCHAWMPEAADALFRKAIDLGWLPEGGFAYTLGNDGSVSRDWRLWWPVAEAIAAAWTLNAIRPDPFYREWYERCWSFADLYLIDHMHGGWFHQIDADGKPETGVFSGKPDIYHALQACLIPAGMMWPVKT